MPDERLITEIENILSQVVELGAEKERTRLGPNLLVRNAAPTGLDNYVLVRDDRDGDNILALKVPGVIYNTNDLVNVLFVRGGEAIAFQQGSGSDSSGIWGIVTGTSTDIFYNDGDVGIGKSIAPDARLEILDASQAQLRLTHTEDTDFTDITVDTNGNVLIDPSGSGQVQLNADLLLTGGTQDFLIGDRGSTGTIILEGQSAGQSTILELFTNDGDGTDITGVTIYGVGTTGDIVNRERLLIRSQAAGTYDIFTEANGTGTLRPLLLYAEGNTNQLYLNTDGNIGIGTANPGRELEVAAGSENSEIEVGTYSATDTHKSGLIFQKSSSGTIDTLVATAAGEDLGRILINGVDTNSAARNATQILFEGDAAPDSNAVPGRISFWTSDLTSLKERMRIDDGGNVGVGATNPSAQLHIDQSSTTGGEPVLYLDQADISEEIIWFRSESAAGTADQSLVDATDFTTPGALLGWIKSKIDDQRVGGLGTIDAWIPFYAIPTA